MKVTLLQYDEDALDLLIMTKQTRLSVEPGLLETVRSWPMERKLEELGYMLDTIESSWEFATYTFLITGVSRAFTHQMVRTRTGSYAQQAQRVVDMTGFEYVVPGSMVGSITPCVESTADEVAPSDEPLGLYREGMRQIDQTYARLIEAGVPRQDARGILPTNVATSIIGKFDLRSLSQMATLRLCTRTQGEYQSVFRAMREAVIAVHPWAEPFLKVHCAKYGVCAFPRYQECPIKGAVFNPSTGLRWDGDAEARPATLPEIQDAWQEVRYESVPTSGDNSRKAPAP